MTVMTLSSTEKSTERTNPYEIDRKKKHSLDVFYWFKYTPLPMTDPIRFFLILPVWAIAQRGNEILTC
jgi:hypothetical protein